MIPRPSPAVASSIAVYRHQVEALAEAGPALLTCSATPHAALGRWIDFLERLKPVCAQLLDAAAGSGEIRAGLDPTNSSARRRHLRGGGGGQ